MKTNKQSLRSSSHWEFELLEIGSSLHLTGFKMMNHKAGWRQKQTNLQAHVPGFPWHMVCDGAHIYFTWRWFDIMFCEMMRV